MFNNVGDPGHAGVRIGWVAGILFCMGFLVGMSVMEVVLIMVVMIGLVIMVVCMYVSIVRHISGHLMVMDLSLMVVMVPRRFVVVAMFMMVISMLVMLCVVMYMLLQIHIHALLFLSVDRHFHMRSGNPALHSRFCLNRKSRQPHLIHCL